MFFLGDIGRTKTRMAVSLDSQAIGEPIIRPTPTDFNQGLGLIKELISSLGSSTSKGKSNFHKQKREGLCLGVSRKVWPGAPLKPELEETFGGPVYLENDAALGGLGEAHYGAGRDHQIIAYLTVSTGVGGVKIDHGSIANSAFGFEPGHQLILVNDKPQSLEELVSGAAVEAKFGQLPHEITDESIWQELSQYLAIGLVNTLVHWSPDCLILGGSMFKTPGFKIEKLEKIIAENLTIFPRLPIIKLAELGESSGLYGGLIYLRKISLH